MSINIVNYSEKAIAVFGDTKPLKDHFSALGGKYNPSLKKDDEKVPGWVFPVGKKDDVKKVITSYIQGNLGEPEKKVKSSYSSSAEKTTNDFTFDKQMYLSLVSRVEKLEAELELSRKLIDKLTSSRKEYDDDVKVKKVSASLKFKDDEDELYDEEPKEIKSLFKVKSK